MSASSIDNPRGGKSSSRRKMVELIRDLRVKQSYNDQDEMERLSRKLLQAVGHELRLRDFIEYMQRRAHTAQESGTWLDALEDYFEQLPPVQDYLTRIPLWEGQWYGFYAVEDCLYFLLGSHLGPDNLVRPEGEGENVVYARLASRLLPTRYRRLKEIARRLDPEKYFAVNSSAIVRLECISSFDTRPPQKRVYLSTRQGRESFVVARLAVPILRRLLGLD